MPNWCYNKMTVSHKDQSKIEEVASAIREERLFQYWLPMPKELEGTRVLHRLEPLGASDTADAHEARAEQFGAGDWYTWRVKFWGVKWDIGFFTIADAIQFDPQTNLYSIECTYDTAWGPAVEVIEHAGKLGFEIRNFYLEGGMAFCGVVDASPDGVSDETFSWGDADLSTENDIDEFLNDIPSDLIDAVDLREHLLSALPEEEEIVQ